MNEILSQEEVNALLRGVISGEVETQSETDDVVGTSYDFTNQERIKRGRMPSLELVNERLGRFFRLSLTSSLGKMIKIVNIDVSEAKYVDFMKKIPFPSSMNVFKMEPLKGNALMIIDASLVFLLIEYFFGGTGREFVKPEGREFTPIEQKIIKKVVLIFLSDLEKAWQPVETLQTKYIRSEINPQFVNIVSSSEIVVAVELKIEVENFQGKILLCFPYAMVEPLRNKLHSGLHSESKNIENQWSSIIKENLYYACINLQAILGETELSIDEILNLKVGDVIPLRKQIKEDLILKIEDVQKLKGKPGAYKGSQAIKITEFL